MKERAALTADSLGCGQMTRSLDAAAAEPNIFSAFFFRFPPPAAFPRKTSVPEQFN
jgi:hypothetical protein